MSQSTAYRIGVLTLSDKGSRGERTDLSGPVVAELLVEVGEITETTILPDSVELIASRLIEWVDEKQLDLIVTTGGTGLTPRDVTPQATLQVIDYEIPGMSEAMRVESLKKTTHAMLSRAVVGVRGRCLVVNLPGSPRAARENLQVVLPALPHALAKLSGDPADCGES